ncbi:hypothetical protein JD844_008536 [Phrynosoma platyrhinos]|uniref:Cell division cycle 20B n=1 Tax=Phrynosoma platyrhinos TaxID=52577 RepID=A0ABQ7TDX1_PHRPL|nr:hypothetical protein JD844_008536 [Phrynosoma platyrhinos]
MIPIGCKGGSHEQNISAHNEACPLQPETRFHVTGLRDDYYLNILDWSQANLIALALESVVHIWNGERSEKLESIFLYSGSKYIASLAWMRENSYLALGTSDGEVQVGVSYFQSLIFRENEYGAANLSILLFLTVHSGSRLGYIHHHDIREAKQYIGMVRQSKQSISSLQWSPDTKLLACGSSDGLLNIWSNDLGVEMHCTPLNTVLHSSAVKVRWRINLQINLHM